MESSFFALQTTADQPDCQTFLCGRYVDRFERRDGEWRIARRTVVYDWIDERKREALKQDDAALFGLRQPVGRAAPHDAVYALLSELRGA